MPGLNLDSGYLLASVLWGGIGSGYLIYGWKQKHIPALVGGVALTAACFIPSVWMMSAASIAIMVGVYYWSKSDN